ncbi:MAG: LLM class flavin-dependent oxidoreductase [Thermoleophilia bacterium]|nr:LLM class flavin-dependent oxidoreductase [Thermoleophilia bacterium]MDH3725765.1 LLM class flavin-dependent oxidoreductase [Thermoleophilia bacterium]
MSTPAISAFFAPVVNTPEHIRLAEELGFDTAWVYDSPLLYSDPFITLARAAERTERIRLGVGLIVPGLRTPVATAAAVRTLTGLASGRVTVAVGAGFTGRFTLGLGPVSLGRLQDEVSALRALLAGESALHPEGGHEVLPIPVPGAEGDLRVPFYVSCRGTKTQALAGRIGDGAMTGIFYPGGLGVLKAGIGADIPLCVHAVGSVADDGEPLDSPRLVAAAGPVVAVAFHAFAEQPWRLENVDAELREQAEGYVASVSADFPERRYQQLHRGHLVEIVLPQDREVATAANIARFSFTGTAAALRERAQDLAADGVAELAVQPGGDIPAELRRLAGALIHEV